MVHKALNLLESRLPPLLVRRLVGLPFFNVRPSGRLEAQDEGLKSVIHPDSGYCGSRSLQRLAGKTTLFSRLYFTPGPRHLAIPLSSP